MEQKIQKSLSFILPNYLNIYSNKYNNIVSTYMGATDFYGDDSWGEHFFVLFKDITAPQLKELRQHNRYVNEYDPEEGFTMIVFNIENEFKEKVVQPFLNGKYSKIDREYVKKHFSPTNGIGMVSNNWLILTRSPILKKYWESRIGVTLAEDAEVWSRPEKIDEIYN